MCLQFVELSGALCRQWMRFLNEIVFSHKLAEARAKRMLSIPLKVFEDEEEVPWLPSFVAENIQRTQAIETVLGKDIGSLLLCTASANVGEGQKADSEGGCLIRQLYCTYGAFMIFSKYFCVHSECKHCLEPGGRSGGKRHSIQLS